MDPVFLRQFMYVLRSLLQLILLILYIEIMLIDPQVCQIKIKPKQTFISFLHLPFPIDQGQQLALINILPIFEIIDNLMRAILEQKCKCLHILRVQNPKGVFEVKLCQIGYKIPIFLILLKKLP